MASKSVNIHEAKTHLSRLIARVQKGQEIVIAKSGKPVARLVPMGPPPQKPAPFGFMKGAVIYMADDFDAPLEDFEDAFYNWPIFPDSQEKPR